MCGWIEDIAIFNAISNLGGLAAHYVEDFLEVASKNCAPDQLKTSKIEYIHLERQRKKELLEYPEM